LVTFTLAAAISTPTVLSVDLTLSGNTACQFRDVVVMYGSVYRTSVSWSSASFSYVNADGTPAVISASYKGYWDDGPGGYNDQIWTHFADTSRALRDNVLKYRLSIPVTSAEIGHRIAVTIKPFNGWPLTSLPVDLSGIPWGKLPSRDVRYAYAYERVSDGGLSALSPELTITTSSDMPLTGYYLTGAVDLSTELGATDKINVYRQEKSTGKWRKIMNTDCATYGFLNTGTVTFTDGWMEHELAAFPEYSQGVLGGWVSSEFQSQNSVAIGVWKGSLAVATRRLGLISYIGNPESFAPSPDDTEALQSQDPEDDNLGVTEYISANRAEDVLGVHGQDALYYITASGVYAKVGDKPLTSTPPRRLPGSRGALGTRASAKYRSGVIVGSQDGLFLYAVSRAFSGIDDGSDLEEELTATERTKWADLISGAYEVVVAEHKGDIWAWNGTSYVCRSKDGWWSSGDFADVVKAPLSVPARGLYFADSLGRLMKLDTSVETDGGEEIVWTYETGIEDTQRIAVRNMIVMATGEPEIMVKSYDGSNLGTTLGPTAQEVGKQWSIPFHGDPGFRHQVVFSGISGADSIDTVLLELEGAGAGKGN
jgi:hypothetical protein